MPIALLTFVCRLFLDAGAVAIAAVIGAIAWPFTSWKTGLLIAVGVDVALCIYSTFLTSDWNVDFSYEPGIARLKKSLAAGKSPDQALEGFLEDLGRESEYMKDWLTLEVDSIRKGPADVELLASAVAVLSTKVELEAKHEHAAFAAKVQRMMTEMKPRWKTELQSALDSRKE